MIIQEGWVRQLKKILESLLQELNLQRLLDSKKRDENRY